MRKRIITLVSLLLTLSVLTVGVVRAETTNTDSSANSKRSTMSERVKARQAALKLRLSSSQEAIIKNRCVFAQTRIKVLQARVKGVVTARIPLYTTIETSLTTLSAKLKVKGLNTEVLDGQITVLKTKDSAFDTNLVNYKQAVDDLVAIDCKVDPAGFKASLETARTLRQTLFASAKEIRTYLEKTIRPTLISLKAEIQTPKSDTNSTPN